MCRYIGRLHDSLQNFSARFSDIDAIHRQALAAQRAQAKPKWWIRVLPSFFRRFAHDSEDVLSFMASLDENQVIEVTTDALGGTLPAHRGFEVRYRARRAASEGIQRNRGTSKKRAAHERETASSNQQKTRESAAAMHGLKTSGVNDPVRFSLKCGTRRDMSSADLVEVVVDPPSAVIVERNSRTGSSGNRQGLPQADNDGDSAGTAAYLNTGETANFKRTTHSVTALSSKFDSKGGDLLLSTSRSSAPVGADILPRTDSSVPASILPNRSLQCDDRGVSQFSGAHHLSSSPASMSAAAAAAAVSDSVRADFIEKIDSKSGRSYWLNLKTKARLWAPPDSWNAARARNDAAVTSVLSAAGAAPAMSASVQRRDDRQHPHTIPAAASASTVAAERIRRQNLADLAAAGDAVAIKLAGSGRSLPDSHVKTSPSVRVDENESIELEEVVVQSATAPVLKRDKGIAAVTSVLSASGAPSATNFTTMERRIPESHDRPSSVAQVDQHVKAELDKAHSHNVQREKQKSSSLKHQVDVNRVLAQTITALPEGDGADAVVKHQPTNVSDVVASGSSQLDLQQPFLSNSVTLASETPLPFDEEVLNSVKRREEKATARTARK